MAHPLWLLRSLLEMSSLNSAYLNELGSELTMGVMNDLFDQIEAERSKPVPDTGRLEVLERQHYEAVSTFYNH